MKIISNLRLYSGVSNDAYVMPSLENTLIGQLENFNQIPVKPIIQSVPVITATLPTLYDNEGMFTTIKPLNGVITVSNTPVAIIPVKGQGLTVQQNTNNETIVIPSNSSLKVSTMLIDVAGKPIASANISVNGVQTAQTNQSGIVTIPNLKPTDTLTFSYIGYDSQTYVASQIPEKITLKEGSIMLDEVPIKPPFKEKPAKKTNWLLLLLLGGGTAYAINEANKPSEKKPKKVTAKI